MDEKFDSLKLENQLCFPLYACAKEVVRRYKPFLDVIDLTYTQYIAMMVMWDKKEVNVKELGESLFLDSGTLTPVLKKLESKGYITRRRSKDDERNLVVSLTKDGEQLKELAIKVPAQMRECMNIDEGSTKQLYELLYNMLESMD